MILSSFLSFFVILIVNAIGNGNTDKSDFTKSMAKAPNTRHFAFINDVPSNNVQSKTNHSAIAMLIISLIADVLLANK